ncbi:MAG: hypothetical protein HFH72_08935 [Lachnospiraceae bacterium]|nr:hypothetical protein [Lachnospiraceae bacterium]
MINVPQYERMLRMDDGELRKCISEMKEKDAKELLFLIMSFANNWGKEKEGKGEENKAL